MAVDAQGHIFVVDNGNDRVQVFTRDGRFLTGFGAYGTTRGQIASPAGIAVGLDVTLYISAVGTDRITAVRLLPLQDPAPGTPVPG